MQVITKRLRATRANPPGMASSDGPRRDTYAALLQQFDDLMTAASAVGPVTRPLPLYYAVLQAGKAIAAAWIPGDDWPARGHGLIEDDTGDRQDVLHFRVKPSPVSKSGEQVPSGRWHKSSVPHGLRRVSNSGRCGQLSPN